MWTALIFCDDDDRWFQDQYHQETALAMQLAIQDEDEQQDV
jgi:hypothetical protein